MLALAREQVDRWFGADLLKLVDDTGAGVDALFQVSVQRFLWLWAWEILLSIAQVRAASAGSRKSGFCAANVGHVEQTEHIFNGWLGFYCYYRQLLAVNYYLLAG